MRPRVLVALALATLREFWRSREAVFWTYGFPVLLAIVLGMAFGQPRLAPARVAVIAASDAGALQAALADTPELEVAVLDGDLARAELAAGRIEIVVGGSPAAPRLWAEVDRAESRLAQLQVESALQRHAGREDPLTVVHEPSPTGQRYIDRLIPGLIGLNVLGAGLWGVGFNLVDMRARHLLRRLVVAPMSRAEFLLAFLLSRLGLVVLNAVLILVFGIVAYDLPVRGAWATVLGLLVLQGAAFSGLGLAVASRPKTVEGVAGLMNLVSLPMWLLCGSFFDTSHFPAVLRPLVVALPLTHANDALRAVLLDGQGLAAIAPQVGYLVLFTAAMFGLAVRFFRWT